MAVNRWSRATAEDAVAFAYEQWERRSDQTWTSDFSWVTRTHGIELDPDGAGRADAANRSLLDKAARQATANESDLSRDMRELASEARHPAPHHPPPRRGQSILRFLKSIGRKIRA